MRTCFYGLCLEIFKIFSHKYVYIGNFKIYNIHTLSCLDLNNGKPLNDDNYEPKPIIILTDLLNLKSKKFCLIIKKTRCLCF